MTSTSCCSGKDRTWNIESWILHISAHCALILIAGECRKAHQCLGLSLKLVKFGSHENPDNTSPFCDTSWFIRQVIAVQPIWKINQHSEFS